MPRPRRRFGQHWLRSPKVLQQIVAAAELSGCDRILEIGPGTGILTQALLATGASVVAVEVDRDLCQRLVHQFGQNPQFLLLAGDILSLDLPMLLGGEAAPLFPNKVVANIPYYLTGEILQLLLGQLSVPRLPRFESIVLLVQKEVAERVVALPGSKTYGALSVRVQCLADCEWICAVPAKAFQPAPKVDSAVVRLRPRSYPIPIADPQWLETLVRVGFASRRKMLRNNLKAIVDLDGLTTTLTELNINPQARAEDLSVAEWVTLCDQLPRKPTAQTLQSTEQSP
ncbi:16S rRNA (adenine(1518)-N(6)/adenine(1519)-N(6))-dimethyltransferase RsmA [Synechococcales cyanobacterium C]|uniref:Ribosomal RNA small subunit methyltransferase A n=1 Tax=Petrachloros mirabilis ULC683 TaxID=2781853 RepID=A0A8K2A9A9_9CYAN|nr:16S rRNA (adenine(1518)-N(6)/adenine(1519)-N(6))-dimethyltransferase RsmA [Petrachloros mirabilis ULC683]